MVRKVGRPAGKALERKNITVKEFEKIIQYIVDSNMVEHTKQNAIKAFYLLYYFGFRTNEASDLKVYDIRKAITEKVISLSNDTKNKTPREAYLDPVQVGILEEVFREELLEEDRFFVIRSWGRPMSRYSGSSILRLLNDIIHKALGSKNYSTHSFRGGYITELHDNGVSIKTIQKIIGHKKEVTTMRYISVTEDSCREGVTKRTPVPSINSFSNKKNA